MSSKVRLSVATVKQMGMIYNNFHNTVLLTRSNAYNEGGNPKRL